MCITENYFSYFSTKTNVVVTQKNRLNETVLLRHPIRILGLLGKKIITILRSKILLIWTYAYRMSEVRCQMFRVNRQLYDDI